MKRFLKRVVQRWKLLPSAVMLAAAMLAGGCGNDKIRVYRTPKERSASEEGLPEGWRQIPASGMRALSFLITGKDGKQAGMSVIPGIGGSDLDNVNLWRSQVGQPPVSEEEIKQ